MPLIPAGSTTASRQTAINANPDGTSFCIEAGSHDASGPNTPKNGNTFTGQYGATIDGTGWASSTDEDAVFKAHNAAIINVTIRNLRILNMPQRGVHAYPWDDCTGWVIENCEIADCAEAIVPGNGARIRRNLLHGCHRAPGHPGGLSGGAILAGGSYPNVVDDIIIEDNEIYDCGAHSKLLDANNIVWRRNFIHEVGTDPSLLGPAIWSDGDGFGFIAEDNIIDGCGRGIHFELSRNGIIRRNTIRNCLDQAIFVSTSRDAEIYENTLRDNFRAIAYFVNLTSVGTFGWDPDLRDNNAYNNTIRVPNTASVLANFLSYANASAGSEVPYVNNSKNNNFATNAYTVPSLSGTYWLYGAANLNFTAWQALPQDAGGSVSL